MSSCKHEIPVLSGFLTKQVVRIPEKENCIDLGLFKNGFISPGSKLQLKVQKMCTTTRACLFPDTLYSLIPHNESQLERLFYFASVFHVHWLSPSFTAAGASVKLHRSASRHQIHSESTQICSQAKKNKCTCKCLSSFPLHPSLQVSIICSSQVSLQVIATILLPGLTMKPDNTFSQSSEAVSHYDWHTNSQLEHITPTGIPLLSRLHTDSFWPSVLNQVWTKALRQKNTTDVPPPGWQSHVPYDHLIAPDQ